MMRPVIRLLVLHFLIALLHFPTPVLAQDVDAIERLKGGLAAIQAEIVAIEKASLDPTATDSTLAAHKSVLQKASQSAFELALAISAQLKKVDEQIAALGPPPEAGTAPENDVVAAERQRLTLQKGETTVALREAERLTVQTAGLIDRVVQLRSEKFAEKIFARHPLSLAVLQEVRDGTGLELNRLNFTFSNWLRVLGNKLGNEALIAAAISFGFAVVIAVFARTFLFPWVARPLADKELPYLRRVFAALSTALIPSATVAAIAAVGYLSFRELSLLPPKVNEIVRAAMIALSLLTFVLCLTWAVLAPGRVHWRLMAIPEHAARRLTVLIGLLAVVYVGDYLFAEIRNAMASPIGFTVVASFAATLIFAFILALILTTQVGMPVAGEVPATRYGWPIWFYWPMWLAIIVIVAAALVGFVSFARFLAGQIVVTGAVLVAMYIGFQSAKSVSRAGALVHSLPGNYLTRRLRFSELSVDQLGLVAGGLLFLGTLMIGIPFILLQWGFQQEDVLSWVSGLLGGFQIGEVRISFGNIILAIVAFVVGLVFTRMLQRWLTSSVLPRTRIDAGVKNSISAGFGYVGFIIAAAVALNYTGIDLSNLALIAGALSVGIGFGLQNVVNNFVSGIILLVERPIRVGDWIVVGNTQGYVKKISVRATELETFDRQSIVIPNAELINTSVGNWMLKDRTGRLIVTVGVDYNSNEEEVRDILYRLIADDDRIAREPEPYVYFSDFGDSALIFEVRVFLKDVSTIIRVGGDLRFAIRKAFREAGIEIPFPQRDIHVRHSQPERELAKPERKTHQNA